MINVQTEGCKQLIVTTSVIINNELLMKSHDGQSRKLVLKFVMSLGAWSLGPLDAPLSRHGET